MGHFYFRSLGNLDDLVAADDGHRVAVRIEAHALARNVIDHDGVEILR